MPRAVPVTCPVCGGAGDIVSSGAIEYDRCGSCGGVWLDCGELEVLLALAHRSGKEKALRSHSANGPALVPA
ncbi:zf-TFIIB domain-containing protein [Sphingomonas lenta]|uniref:Transcription factor zinc-finger domain-containing protein n=1 Tax=Sphingomonas lenta TaxID=1141887 RepID=A0A2A2SHV7_9SPHN|nr:zf-TFIIB domain-containing protein [Sphingomonas lenta]PAX08864.1 hypothetical protein CKY28_05785 [Sphingomonas lenta]